MPSEPAPKGLASAGKALWRAILGDVSEGWALDARELHLLERACVCADRLADLDAAVERDGATAEGSRGQTVVHPALSEARQLELVQLRLLSAIQLPDEDEEPRTLPGQRGRRAARARWDRRDRIRQARAA